MELHWKVILVLTTIFWSYLTVTRGYREDKIPLLIDDEIKTFQINVDMNNVTKAQQTFKKNCYYYHITIEKNPFDPEHYDYEKCLPVYYPPPPKSFMPVIVPGNTSKINTFVFYQNKTYKIEISINLLLPEETCIEDLVQETTDVTAQCPLTRGAHIRTYRDKYGTCWKVVCHTTPTDEPPPPSDQIIVSFDPFVKINIRGIDPDRVKSAPQEWVIQVTIQEGIVTDTAKVKNKWGEAYLITVQVRESGAYAPNATIIRDFFDLNVEPGNPDSYWQCVKDQNQMKWCIALIQQRIPDENDLPIRDIINIIIDFSKMDPNKKYLRSILPSTEHINFNPIKEFNPDPNIIEGNRIMIIVKVVKNTHGSLMEVRIIAGKTNKHERPDLEFTGGITIHINDPDTEGCNQYTFVDKNHLYTIIVCLAYCGRQCIPHDPADENNYLIKIDIGRILDYIANGNPSNSAIQPVPDPPQKIPRSDKLIVYLVPNFEFPLDDLDDGFIWHYDPDELTPFEKRVTPINGDSDYVWSIKLTLTPADESSIPEFNSMDSSIYVHVRLIKKPFKSSRQVLDKNGGVWIITVEMKMLFGDYEPDLRTPTKNLTIVIDLHRLRSKTQDTGITWVLLPKPKSSMENGRLLEHQEVLAQKNGRFWLVTVNVTKTNKPKPPYINVGDNQLRLLFDLLRSIIVYATVVDVNVNFFALNVQVREVDYVEEPDISLDPNEHLEITENFGDIPRSTPIIIKEGIFEWIGQLLAERPVITTERGHLNESVIVKDGHNTLWTINIILDEQPYYQTPELKVYHEKMTLLVDFSTGDQSRTFLMSEPSKTVWTVTVNVYKTNNRFSHYNYTTDGSRIQIAVNLEGLNSLNRLLSLMITNKKGTENERPVSNDGDGDDGWDNFDDDGTDEEDSYL